jgi:hypothetical protein
MKPLQLKRNLYIGTIGTPQCGKTVALRFLLDHFWDLGVRDFHLVEDFSSAKPAAIFKATPTLVLIDGINEEKLASDLKDMVILIRIRRGPSLFEHANWSANFPSHLFLTNDGPMRLFEKQLQDLVNNEMPKLAFWKDAVKTN